MPLPMSAPRELKPSMRAQASLQSRIPPAAFARYSPAGLRSKKAMDIFTSDPKWKKFMDPKNLPFDGKRMFWGGFKPIVEL